MKTRTLVFLGCGAALILTTVADAAYTGLSVEFSNSLFDNHPSPAVKAAWLGGPNNEYYIFRVYANFNSNTAADRVNAVAGAPGSPLSVNATGGSTFYNYTDSHGNHYNLPGVVPASRAWDTWVTIGQATNGGTTGLTPGFDVQTNNLGGNTSTIGPSINVAWFITPDNTQGQAVATAPFQAPAPPGVFRVLLAQFAVTQAPAAGIAGSWLVNVNGQDLLNQTFITLIPAPGALALLGLAGVVGARRRRG